MTAPAPAFDFSGLDAAELDQRRATLQAEIERLGGVNALDVPIEKLQEFAYLTQAMRRKNAGPPRAKTAAKRTAKATSKESLGDLLDL